MASTHLDNPLLPCGVQAPSRNLGSATLALVEEGNEPVPFEFAMAAAAQSMRNDLANIAEAKHLEDWPEWDKLIECELDQHEKMHTWELIEPPNGVNIVGSCFILHYKHVVDSHISSQKTC